MDEQRVHLPSAIKGPSSSWRPPEARTVQQHPGIILVCWKSTLAFFKMTAISSFVSFLLIFQRAAASHWWAVVIELPLLLQLAAAFRAVSEVLVLCLPLASSLSKLWVFFLCQFSHCSSGFYHCLNLVQDLIFYVLFKENLIFFPPNLYLLKKGPVFFYTFFKKII